MVSRMLDRRSLEGHRAGALALRTVDTATGRTHHDDPVVGRSGGPAGNRVLTAWTGLLLLALIIVELVTVLDVRGMISWHIVVGTLLVPLALLKTASTSWRVVRYYTGHPVYREAGPPPTLLRWLGPLVVISTLGLLGTGLGLIAVGQRSGRQPFALGLDLLTLHQALFIVFGVVTGLHLLARIVPAVRLSVNKVAGAQVPAVSARLGLIALAVVAAVITAALVLGAAGDWRKDRGGFDDHQRPPQGVTAPLR